MTPKYINSLNRRKPSFAHCDARDVSDRWRTWLEGATGRWVLKDSEANRGQAVHFIDCAVPQTVEKVGTSSYMSEL